MIARAASASCVELKERTDADRRVARRPRTRAPRKGRSFEELVHAALEQIAAGARRRRRITSATSSSEAGGKKGDTVVEIGARRPARARGHDRLRGQEQEAVEERRLDRAQRRMGERDAVYAVLVVAGEDKVPSGLEELTEYQGNKIIAVLDREEPDPLALEARLSLRPRAACSRRRATSSRSTRPASATPPRRRSAAQARQPVRKSLTNVDQQRRRPRDEFDEMVADVERCLARIEVAWSPPPATRSGARAPRLRPRAAGPRAAAGRSGSSVALGADLELGLARARCPRRRRPCSRPLRA